MNTVSRRSLDSILVSASMAVLFVFSNSNALAQCGVVTSTSEEDVVVFIGLEGGPDGVAPVSTVRNLAACITEPATTRAPILVSLPGCNLASPPTPNLEVVLGSGDDQLIAMGPNIRAPVT